MDNLKNIIKTRLNELEISPIEAAIKVGLERGYIRDYLEDRKKTFRQDKLPLLAKALELNVSDLLVGGLNKLPQSNARIIGSVDFDQTKKIPVYGQAVGGIDGEFVLNGNRLYDILCPPQLQAVAGSYGVVVSGDSMSPRYFDGEVVYVDPTRRTKKGDFVVAQVMIDENSPPHAFVKRFCKHNANELVLEQFNPQKELIFPHERVVSVHYIVMSGDAI
ncbi:LexA family transcriptional regulator [Bartonella tamiae]|uniref:HTH cro/C1-type domain-containing protein n=1 Tax=Bartonella tamiae Th239 TaxID=1094558 RepID=J1K2E1_9HYPH|nr:S24 family peptidase [Bartonella tamiae]EJF91652.1 hypothetical protein ME5_00031 [Bartonella tamiae Th239]